jgi:hypothetical protein
VGVYNIDEGMLDLPGTWNDQSINVLGRPVGDGSNFGVVVTRFQLQDEQTVEAFATKHLEDHAQILRGFELLGRRGSVIGNLPAVEAKIRWVDGANAMFHYIAFVAYYKRVLLFTASSYAKNAEECEKLMIRILATAKFRER